MPEPTDEAHPVIAGYRARRSDITMIRWVTPAVVVVMVALGFVAGNSVALVAFLVGATVVAVRWAWVTTLGSRPLVLDAELTDTELSVRTLRGETVVASRQVRTLMPVGFRPRPRGPRSLITDAGTFTLYPDGRGFDELVTALEGFAPRLRVEPADAPPELPPVSRSLPETSAPASHPTGAPAGVASHASASETTDAPSDLAPGVVAVALLGSQALGDRTVEKLEAAGITALALPSVSGLGGVRVTVAESDRERAEAVLREE